MSAWLARMNPEGVIVVGAVLAVSAVGQRLLGGPMVLTVAFGIAAAAAIAALVIRAAIVHEREERDRRPRS